MSAKVEKFELETHHRIYNNNTGDYISVGPDRDGLELIEVRSVQVDGQEETICMNEEQAKLVLRALNLLLMERGP
jgi:hypothetical protein